MRISRISYLVYGFKGSIYGSIISYRIIRTVEIIVYGSRYADKRNSFQQSLFPRLGRSRQETLLEGIKFCRSFKGTIPTNGYYAINVIFL